MKKIYKYYTMHLKLPQDMKVSKVEETSVDERKHAYLKNIIEI